MNRCEVRQHCDPITGKVFYVVTDVSNGYAMTIHDDEASAKRRAKWMNKGASRREGN
jgi:hypothetical protein